MTLNRKDFLKKSTLGSLAGSAWFAGISRPDGEAYNPLRIGLCADLHHDLIFDSVERLTAFIEEMEARTPDFIMQLGDFCFPRSDNEEIMDIWDRYSGPAFHVIGNHDPEGSHTIESVVDFWQMEAPYYSFDINGYHIVVLNGNDRNPDRESPLYYPRYIGDEQLEWLESDLAATSLPAVVFCHQGLDNEMGVENAQRIRIAFEDANRKAGFRKVQLVITGHHHKDYHNVINGIHYLQINSMSYHWQGDRYVDLDAFPDELHKEYPRLRNMAYYEEPIWAFMEISPQGLLRLSGRETSFVGRPPRELNMPRYEYGYPVVSRISNREIQLTQDPFVPDASC